MTKWYIVGIKGKKVDGVKLILIEFKNLDKKNVNSRQEKFLNKYFFNGYMVNEKDIWYGNLFFAHCIGLF